MNAKTKKVRALIVDDEPLARRTIRELLCKDPDVEIVAECSSGLEALAFMAKQLPDLLFLDIQMPGLNGFETLAKVQPEKIPAIVFVTAYDQHALKAFEVHAVDYLLKPFTDERFEEMLKQAKDRIELKEIQSISKSLLSLVGDAISLSGNKKKDFLNRFMIKVDERVIIIKALDVDWISAEDYFIKLHVSGKSHLLRMSMNELEQKLDPEAFLRVHRSTIVNFDRLKELRQTATGEYVVVLRDGTKLKLSRSRRARLQQLLMNSPNQ